MTAGESYTPLKDVERDEHTVLTVGFFDGIHLGHRSVLSKVQSHAHRLGCRSLMVTFDRPPRSVLHEQSVSLLTTLDEKAEIVRSLGLSGTVVIPFNSSFAELDPNQFVTTILVERIGLRTIVLGYDHRFGKGGAGNVDTMRELGAVHGFDVEVVAEQKTDNAAYSSTRIREMLSVQGEVKKAASHLGRYYRLAGRVVHGDGRGKSIGFPTANLQLLNDAKVIPAVGVYAVFVKLASDITWVPGIMNVGFRPTVTDATELVCEVHLLDFDADLYGKTMTVAFVRRIREERRFDGVEDLVRQIRKDLVNCKDVLSSVSLPD